MEILTEDRLRREGLPAGAHLLELVSDRSECALHPHFAGMDCIPVTNLDMVRDRFRTEKPILIHCEQAKNCELAATELGRMGYANLFQYEGNLQDLEPYVAPEHEVPVVSPPEVEALLKSRVGKVHLFNVVPDVSECPLLMVGVSCLEPGGLVEEGLKDLSHGDTMILRCEPGIDCEAMASRAHRVGFRDVRILEGRYEDVRWLERM